MSDNAVCMSHVFTVTFCHVGVEYNSYVYSFHCGINISKPDVVQLVLGVCRRLESLYMGFPHTISKNACIKAHKTGKAGALPPYTR